jgi:hypothetical protein
MRLAIRSLVSAFARSSKSINLYSASFPASILNVKREISSNFSQPAPPPLAVDQQREFENLVRAAQAPLSASTPRGETEVELALHPDARQPLEAEFEGDVNPKTGEEGGPKQEPVKSWASGSGDWSFKGRVTDF